MKRLNIEEIKKKEIEILDYFDSFCIKNDIHYFLDGGTLLGAARHKGFIPWDDDIDVGMTREEYQKFVHTFKDNATYRLYTIDNTGDYYYTFSKLVNIKTELIEPDGFSVKGMGINIDIFVYDKVTNNVRKQKRYVVLYNRIRSMLYMLSDNALKYRNENDYLFFIKKILSKTIGKKRLVRYLSIIANEKGESYISYNDSTPNNIIVFNIELKETVPLLFEGKNYPCPKEYDKYLTSWYDDWRKLPPENERIRKHSFEAWEK